MSILSSGIGPSPSPEPVASPVTETAAPAVAQSDQASKADATVPAARDGVDGAKAAAQADGLAGPHPSAPEANVNAVTDPAGVAEALRYLTSGNPASDPNFRSLPAGVKDGMLAATKNGPPSLVETFKRLANSPQFRKLPAEVQAKAAALLAKVANHKGDSQSVERLLRSPAFAALPEKEQLKMVADLGKTKEARDDLQKTMDSPQNNGKSMPFSDNPVQVATLLQMAKIVESVETRLGPGIEAVPPDPERGGRGASSDAPAGKAGYLEIKRLISELRAAPELSPATVEAILGVTLAPVSAGAAGRAFAAAAAAGPFHRIELRQASGPARRIDLEVRPGVEVLYKDFRGDFIPVTVAPDFDPAIQPDGELRFRLADEWPKQDLHLGFAAKTQRLRSVSIERDTE